MAANSPLEVLSELAIVIRDAKLQNSRNGFFAALYELMTDCLIQKVKDGSFVEPDRIRDLIVVFANRYLAARGQYAAGQPPSRCWRVAFKAAANDRLIILQHLLLAMNAHLNFDLAVAVEEVVRAGTDLTTFKPDYDRVNSVFAELIELVQNRLATISPSLNLLGDLSGEADDAIAGFSLEHARTQAWNTAIALRRISEDTFAYDAFLTVEDLAVAGFGQAITNPLLTEGLRPIRDSDSDDIPAIIDAIRGRTT